MKFARNVVGTKIKESLVQVNQFSFWNQHSVGVPNPLVVVVCLLILVSFSLLVKHNRPVEKNLHFKKVFEEQA